MTNCGAEAIAFLKVYGVIPAATLFMVLFTKLANRFDSQTLFYITIAPFFAFFASFAFVLYPLRNVLHPLHWQLPSGGLSFPVNLLRHWTFSLFFIVSELWGSAGIPLLFWSCANSLVSLEQSSRWYPLISLFGNLAPILSGITMSYASKLVGRLNIAPEFAFEKTLKIITSSMLVAGGVITWLHRHVHSIQVKSEISDLNTTYSKAEKDIGNSSSETLRTNSSLSSKSIQKKRAKPSFVDSLRILWKDKYLRNIGVMVLSYGLTIEFTEIMWKSTVKKAFPVKNDYMAFMGRYSSLVGALAFIMMLMGAQLNQAMGWRVAALTTPVLMGVFALPFFSSIILGGVESKKSLLLAVYVGLLQNALSKATKYAVFDPTKEMTYIPLPKEAKTQGKAAIDVLGARLGKSGGALAQQLLVFIFGSIVSGAPVVATLFYAVVAMWIGSINSLHPMFMAKTKT